VFKNLIKKFFGKKAECDCQKLNLDTTKKEDRVALIYEAAPDCGCESKKTSKFSPYPIANEELIARFVFSPIHINKKNGEIKPSIISHIFNRGCSIQRETIASNDELSRFVSDFLANDPKKERSWNRVLIATCNNLRSITIDDQKALCLYDTAEERNPAHGEICLSREIPEANHAELRFEIMKVFSEYQPNDYRGGKIYNRELSQ
jgi:hypothetical protein